MEMYVKLIGFLLNVRKMKFRFLLFIQTEFRCMICAKTEFRFIDVYKNLCLVFMCSKNGIPVFDVS